MTHLLPLIGVPPHVVAVAALSGTVLPKSLELAASSRFGTSATTAQRSGFLLSRAAAIEALARLPAKVRPSVDTLLSAAMSRERSAFLGLGLTLSHEEHSAAAACAWGSWENPALAEVLRCGIDIVSESRMSAMMVRRPMFARRWLPQLHEQPTVFQVAALWGLRECGVKVLGEANKAFAVDDFVLSDPRRSWDNLKHSGGYTHDQFDVDVERSTAARFDLAALQTKRLPCNVFRFVSGADHFVVVVLCAPRSS